jgi:hypothetical protein
MNKDKIIDKIVHELYEDHFSLKESEFSVGLRDAVELFYQLITTPINNEELDGMISTLPTAIGNFYQSDTGTTDTEHKLIYITTIATAFDAIIKKIFFLTDTAKYTTAINSKWMLKKLVENCGILRSNDFSILWDVPTPITDTSGFPTCLQITYKTRNKVHEAKNWAEHQLSTRYIDCLMTYVYLVLENYSALKSGIENFIKTEEHKKLMADVDMEKYLNSIIAKIENEPTFPRKRYTDLEGEENIDLIDDDFADREIEEDVSMYDDNEEDYTEDDDEEDENFDDKDEDFDEDDYDFTPQREKRKGKISDLRQTIRQMIIRGNPGMGKTTTLRYLSLCDAKQQQPVPFLFYLKGYQSNKGSILAQIAQSNNLKPTWLEQYLNNGYGALYLDGLNEIIDPTEREKLKTDIEGLAAKDINMVVSSREKAYDTDRFKIPVFDLKPLNLQQITDYVRKAYGKKTIEVQTEGVNTLYTPETFADLLQKNAKLYTLCQNPFFLRMYVDVVRRIREFPENTGLLLRTFIKGSTQNGTNVGGLLGREERKPDKAHWRENRYEYETLTEHLAYHTRLQKNVAFSRRSALELMATPNSQYFGNGVNLNTLINDLKDLHLLEENDQQLSFVHELYQEYFAAEALTHLHQKTPNLVATLAAQSNWTEPLILFDGLLQDNLAIFEQISATNSETAARALVASLETQPEKRQINLQHAQTDAQNFADAEASARGFMALLYLGEHNLITKIVKTVKNPNKTHKQIMECIVQSCAAEQLIDFLWTLKDITGTAKPLLDWAVEGIEEELDLGNNIEKGDELIIYWLGNVIYSAIAVKIFAKLKKQNLVLLEVVVEKAMRNNNFKVVVQLVEKYALQEKYPIEFLIEKSVATNNFELADQLVEKYALQERYPIEFLIKKAVATSNFETAVQLVEKYALEEKYPIEFLIEKAIETNNLSVAIQLVEKYALQERYSIEFLIEKAIAKRKFTVAIKLVEKYALQEKYVEKLIKKAIGKKAFEIAVQLVEKYGLQEKYAEKLIGKVIETNNLTFALQLMKKYALQTKYSIEFLIEKAVATNNLSVVVQLVEKYALEEKYPIEFLIEKAIEKIILLLLFN